MLPPNLEGPAPKLAFRFIGGVMAKKRELKNIYKSMKRYVAEVTQSNLQNPDFYKIALRAALAKSYDFNSYVTGLTSSSHSFYHTATLRGMCEDLIVLRALKDIPEQDRSDLIMYLQLNETYEAMKTQEKFLEKNHPQIILNEEHANKFSDNEFAKALAIYDKYGIPRKYFGPSIKTLAKKGNLLEVYDFFYSATSKWVHFSPHILLRMGWAIKGKDEPLTTATYTYTTKHFSNYYASFNAVYGTYLFGLFYESFRDELSLNPKLEKYVTELREWIDSLMRWPELITFEEMNIKTPSLILQALYNVTKGYTQA
jgi:hypothetical protein